MYGLKIKPNNILWQTQDLFFKPSKHMPVMGSGNQLVLLFTTNNSRPRKAVNHTLEKYTKPEPHICLVTAVLMMSAAFRTLATTM